MTKVKEITITLMQQKCLEPLLEAQEIAQVDLKKASRLLYQAEGNFCTKVLEFWPYAKWITHPDKGKWTVMIDEGK